MRRILTLTLLLLALPARADTLEVAPATDTTLYSEGALSNGAGDHLFVGRNLVGNTRRSLVAFDLASIPDGSVVSAVTLRLYVSKVYTDAARPLSVHRLTRAWGEGDAHAPLEEGQGVTATAGGATWASAVHPSTAWTAAGGDYDGTASATATVGSVTTLVTLSGAGMVADVQGWIDDRASAHGWILIGDESTSGTAKRFDARTGGVVQRPRLEIEFTPPAPIGACCVSDACSTTIQADCGGTWTAALSCDPNPCLGPIGACCATDGGCTEGPESGCAGAFEGAATSCSPNPCPLPSGACCTDEVCSIATSATCGGAFQGAATTCSPDPCVLPTGACCATGGGCVESTAADCASLYQGDGTSCGDGCTLTLTPFVDPLPIPRTATPLRGSPGGEAGYRFSVRQVTRRLHRDLPDTTLWVYDDGTGGSFPGPTIVARRNAPVRVTWANGLVDAAGDPITAHILPVDACPHGAARGPTRVVTHLHGGHVPAAFDGHPEETTAPAEEVTYDYPNWQRASALWYHDHALGITRLNVYAGLAGMYIVRDDEEDALDLPSGDHEIPLVIQDRQLSSDGSLVYPATWQEHFFGDHNLVNGVVTPYLDVDRGTYRFRVLNGANGRTYTLDLGGMPFTVIGVDGGLLDAPREVTSVTLGPAERADVLVDFSTVSPGSDVFLRNSAPAPFPGSAGVGVTPDVMVFRVGADAGETYTAPATLSTLPPANQADAVMTRDFVLRRDGTTECGGAASWLINGLGWDAIRERPALGTSEIWRFVNRSGTAHPMHVHLDFFRVLDRQPFELVGDVPTPTGSPSAPEPWERGEKDTVMVGPNEIVRVLVRFTDFTGFFPYHCHILEHEDHEMMRQFEAVTTCGDGARGLPDEECDDGNTVDGDGCSAECAIEPGFDAGPPDAGVGGDGGASLDAGVGPDAGVDDGDGGCGCRAAGGPSSAPWLLLGGLASRPSLIDGHSVPDRRVTTRSSTRSPRGTQKPLELGLRGERRGERRGGRDAEGETRRERHRRDDPATARPP